MASVIIHKNISMSNKIFDNYVFVCYNYNNKLYLKIKSFFFIICYAVSFLRIKLYIVCQKISYKLLYDPYKSLISSKV